ncbi:transmembrane protein 132C [Synchiropus picturatus]
MAVTAHLHHGRWTGREDHGMLLLFWIVLCVRPSCPQPPLPLALPVQLSVVPPSWHFLPLSQSDVSPLFSNSSPFSSSQSLFMLNPAGQNFRAALQASFGPHSDTQLLPEPAPAPAPALSASLLSEHLSREVDERGQETFKVRALFHKRGQSGSRGTCATLHAFKETEEKKVSCVTQLPLGLCVATLTLPHHWFMEANTNQSLQNTELHLHRRVQRFPQLHSRRFLSRLRGSSPSLRYHPSMERERHFGLPRSQTYHKEPVQNQIQLFYSATDTDGQKLSHSGCVEGRQQSQRQLLSFKSVTLKKEEEHRPKRGPNWSEDDEACLSGEQEDEEISLDPHVLIRYQKGPALIGQPLRVSVKLRSNFSSGFAVIRLKVKKGLVSMVAKKTQASELWAVSLEQSQGSKYDVVSILCIKQASSTHVHSPTALQQVVCLSVDALSQSFGVAMSVSAHWWVEYSGSGSTLLQQEAAVTWLSYSDRPIFGIAPITESNRIINTAILTNRPVSLPVMVLAISHNGKLSDITSAVTCFSSSEDIVKVSSDCATVLVDGSESGVGSTCAEVRFALGSLTSSVCLEVWAPSVPLHVSVADPVLNAIDGWTQQTEEGCTPVFQQSPVQVLTRFKATDTKGRTMFLLGPSDWFVDVTELVHNWLRVENPSVASFGPRNHLIGLRPGRTSLRVVSEHWDGVLGACDITVSSDMVTTEDLSVQVVSGLGLSVEQSPPHQSILTATVTTYNTFHHYHQEASISVWLQFSDDTASLLSSFSDRSYLLRFSSLAESVVVVTPGVPQQIFAQGDGGGPLLRAELLVSTCSGGLHSSNAIGEGDGEGRTTRLAQGSGWIRVNLELEFLPSSEKDSDEEDFDFGSLDTLVDLDGDVFSSNFDGGDNAGRKHTKTNYYDKISGMTDADWDDVTNRRVTSRNNLERAMLRPGQGESFSHNREGEDVKVEERGGQELEVGLGALVSLLCLSALLFLVNCLPCALRDRRKKIIEEWSRKETRIGEEESEVKKVEPTAEDKEDFRDVTEVEIIC